MKISCTNLSKRFNRDWIFRNFNYEFFTSQSYAITGPNGSGKSTLLQVIAGAVANSGGTIEYSLQKTDSKPIAIENVYQHLSIAAPYLEAVEEMTVTEFLRFHETFKPFLSGWDIKKIIEHVGLGNAANKQIRYYSSGMKQRVKLAQAIFSDTPVLLLDEPCTNFDETGIKLYQQLMNDFRKDRLVIVSSNDKQEYGFCEEVLSIMDWK